MTKEPQNISRAARKRLLTYLLLESRCNLVTEKESKANESQYYADVNSIVRGKEESQYFIACRFRADGAPSTTDLPFKITATYGCLFVAPGEHKYAVAYAKELARTVLWGRFVDLVGLFGTQMNQEMPPLPVLPRAINVDVDQLVASLGSR